MASATPAPPTDFVWPCGTSFCTGPASNPVKQTFAGTNAFYLLLDHVSDGDVRSTMAAAAARGANLLRFFAFSNGPGSGNVVMAHPIQPSLGTFNEDALRRLDLVLAEARGAGLRVIMPLVNFEEEMGGMQWYVDAALGLNGDGTHKDKELFYSDARVKEAYWRYVSLILSRTNSLTGVRYAEDPTIFALELANEPHTSNRWEADRGRAPGALVKAWVWEMAARIKGFDGGYGGMVSTGEEGYRSDGDTADPHSAWINGGFKGVDFVGNTACPDVSFATVHGKGERERGRVERERERETERGGRWAGGSPPARAQARDHPDTCGWFSQSLSLSLPSHTVYPDNWEVPASDYAWVGPHYLADRAAIAHAAGKPLIIEEYGMKAGYGPGRDGLYSYMHAQAEELGIAATLAWAAYAWPVDEGPDSYNFAWGSPGTAALEARFGGVAAANERAAAAAKARAAGAAGSGSVATASARHSARAVPVPPYSPPPPAACADVPPPSGGDCAAQKAYGKCGVAWMVGGGFCRATCGSCTAAPAPTPSRAGGACSDAPPPGSTATCAQQAAWGKCGAAWMGGFCRASCGGCGGGRGSAAAAAAPSHHEAGGQKAGRVAVPGLLRAPVTAAPAPALDHSAAAAPAAAAPEPARHHSTATAPAAAAPAPARHHSAAAAPAAAAHLPTPRCVDVPPPPSDPASGPPPTCKQQKESGPCGRCPPAPAPVPSAAHPHTRRTPKPTHPPTEAAAAAEDGTDDVPGSSGGGVAAAEPGAVRSSSGLLLSAATVAGPVPVDDAPRLHPEAPQAGEMK